MAVEANPSRTPYRTLSALRKEIRILCVDIRQSRKRRTIVGKFKYVSLNTDSLPFFETTSWCWGDATKRASAIIDGTTLDLPSNAAELLWHLCVLRGHSKVWLDAVCINQDDVVERGLHSGLKMGERDPTNVLGNRCPSATGPLLRSFTRRHGSQDFGWYKEQHWQRKQRVTRWPALRRYLGSTSP